MNKSENHKVSDYSDSQFLQKIQKLICKLPKHILNCKLGTANSNPEVSPFTLDVITNLSSCNIVMKKQIF